jgi:phosphatidylinositol alpha-mannosyltransferase
MRIAIACPYAWEAPGGVQVHIAQLAERLRAHGHEVLVLAPGWGPAAEPWVRIVGRPVRVRYHGTVAPICFSVASSRRIRTLLRGFRPDVLHAHEPLSPSTSMLAVRSSAVPVVATFHSYLGRSRLMEAAAPALRSVWRRLDARIAVSAAAATFLAQAIPGRVEVIPNGVDVELFRRPTAPAPDLPPGRTVLWVNRLDPQKGFRVMVRAFALLAQGRDDVALVVVGDGADAGAVATLPEAIRGRVAMLGRVPHGELPPYHAAADVYVSPAVGQESFGIVLVEAMAAGVPVVATDIPGYREVVRDGVDGLLVPPGDAGALAAAVGRVLDDAGLAERLAEAGAERADAFSWDVVMPRIEEIYRRVTGAAR